MLAPRKGAAFFESKVRPVLVHHCYRCHSGDPAKAKGHLVLDTHDGIRKGGDSGPAVAPGHAATSLLIEAVRHEGLEMPPGEMLPDETIADLVTWVEFGAPDPRSGSSAQPKNKVALADAKNYWAFRLPVAHRPPQVADESWPRGEVDRFVAEKRDVAGLKPVADADRATLIRRLSFDLIGLPPSPEEVDAFVGDPSSGAYESLVNRLLASPHFGERWGRHWLDVARFGESAGKDRNLPYRYAWRYRNYVIDAFNQGKPFDRFIVEQLAGDLLPAKDAASRDTLEIATGFLAIGPKGVNVKPEQFRMDQVDDQIDVTSRAFLGMTVACARCHDHKFDPIPTTDYYALAGIFKSTSTYSGVGPGRKTAVDDRLLTLATPPAEKPSAEEVKAEATRRAEIAKLEAQIKELRKAPRQAAKKGKNPKGMVANPFATGPMDRKANREEIKELNNRLDELESVPNVSHSLAMGVIDFESPSDCKLLVRGNLDTPGDPVPRGMLSVLQTAHSAPIPPGHSGRLELARWIASRDNPLTARVMVNRVWEHLFGQGLVDTVDNFGAMGNEPSHPELLDTLAVRFMADNWSVKKLIRAMVLSRTYQLASTHSEEAAALDPADKWLWRMPPRRLEAEAIRDAMLAASGQLDLKRPEGSPILELSNRPGRAKQLPTTNNARGVYLPVLRGAEPETLAVFDLADPSLIVGRRDVTTVPTQALYMMNNPFVERQAEAMARRVLNQEGLAAPARIALAYRLALGRPPSASELARVTRFLEDYRRGLAEVDHKSPQLPAWTSFCQTLFATGEFRYVY